MVSLRELEKKTIVRTDDDGVDKATTDDNDGNAMKDQGSKKKKNRLI
jgi:hypothetical protein